MTTFLETHRRLWLALLLGAGLIALAIILLTSWPSLGTSDPTRLTEPGKSSLGATTTMPMTETPDPRPSLATTTTIPVAEKPAPSASPAAADDMVLPEKEDTSVTNTSEQSVVAGETSVQDKTSIREPRLMMKFRTEARDATFSVAYDGYFEWMLNKYGRPPESLSGGIPEDEITSLINSIKNTETWRYYSTDAGGLDFWWIDSNGKIQTKTYITTTFNPLYKTIETLARRYGKTR